MNLVFHVYLTYFNHYPLYISVTEARDMIKRTVLVLPSWFDPFHWEQTFGSISRNQGQPSLQTLPSLQQ